MKLALKYVLVIMVIALVVSTTLDKNTKKRQPASTPTSPLVVPAAATAPTTVAPATAAPATTVITSPVLTAPVIVKNISGKTVDTTGFISPIMKPVGVASKQYDDVTTAPGQVEAETKAPSAAPATTPTAPVTTPTAVTPTAPVTAPTTPASTLPPVQTDISNKNTPTNEFLPKLPSNFSTPKMVTQLDGKPYDRKQ